MVTYLRNNQAVSWLGVKPTNASHESNVLPLDHQATYSVDSAAAAGDDDDDDDDVTDAACNWKAVSSDVFHMRRVW